MIVDSTAEDIIHTNLFTGIHGNYLRGSIEAVGLGPNDLATSKPAAMNFAADESLTSATSGAKAWRDIWGAGQGIGAVEKVTSASEIVERLSGEYAEARTALLQG